MALLGFIGFLSMSSQRMCITVALVCMLNQTAMTATTAAAAGADQGGALTLGPTPPTATATPAPVNGSSVAADGNATVAGRRAASPPPPPPVRTCGAIPEIFVLNTSDFSRINVSHSFVFVH